MENPACEDKTERYLRANPEVVNLLRTTAILLERTDKILIEMAREALQHGTGSQGHQNPLPITEIHLRRLEDSRPSSQDSQLDIGEIRRYLVALPEFEAVWTNLNRAVLRYFSETVERRRSEWIIWLAQVERAGTATWQKAVNASGVEDVINGLPCRLRSMDELLDAIHGILLGPDAQQRVQFAPEFEDTLSALFEMTKRDMPLEVETIHMFKMIIRQNKTARMKRIGMSTAIDTGSSSSELTFRGPSSSNTAPHAEQTAQTNIELLTHPPETSPRTPSPASRYNPTTLGIILIITVAAAGLTAKGWDASPHEPGTTGDADFWFLLQSSLMQLTGMVPIVFTLAFDPNISLQPRLWSWASLGTGIILAILAPALYCALPTEYSAVLAFVGSVIQVLIILEAMLLVRKGAKKTE